VMCFRGRCQRWQLELCQTTYTDREGRYLGYHVWLHFSKVRLSLEPDLNLVGGSLMRASNGVVLSRPMKATLGGRLPVYHLKECNSLASPRAVNPRHYPLTSIRNGAGH